MKLHESFGVKYRPWSLGRLVGQSTITRQLKGMFQTKKLTRSMLLSGPWGSGKTTLALIVARYINCQNENRLACKKSDPCSSCAYFLKADIRHPDLQYINVGDETGVDRMRTLITSARFAPHFNFRVIVLDEFHQASKAAGSALLVPLENPPPRTIFILCTSNPEKLMPTLYSRCVHFKVKKVSIETTEALTLKIAAAEDIALTKNNARLIAEAVNGHPRDALAALESVSFLTQTQSVQEAVQEVFQNNSFVVLQKLWAKPTAEKIVHAALNINNHEYALRQTLRLFMERLQKTPESKELLETVEALNKTLYQLKLYVYDPQALLLTCFLNIFQRGDL